MMCKNSMIPTIMVMLMSIPFAAPMAIRSPDGDAERWWQAKF
jgi:hypothetical protein